MSTESDVGRELVDLGEWTTVTAQLEGPIAWVTLNRPEKRNAMSPTLNEEMIEVLDAVESDDRARVLVLTGAGESFSAGMDLKEYFREQDEAGRAAVLRSRRIGNEWQYRRLRYFPKPTIAMVNGWCFGGAFVPLTACDLAIAAEEATFGVSEVNWGIPPGSVVSRALAEVLPARDALYLIMTGRPFSGVEAARMRLVNEAVPRTELRDRTRELATQLAGVSQTVMSAAKTGFKLARTMSWEDAEEYLYAKVDQSNGMDEERSRERGMREFLDAKSFRPGLGRQTGQ